MGKRGCTQTTPQPHPCACGSNQINALIPTNPCTENVQLHPMPTNNTHASSALTHRYVSLVSLPRASILPKNLLLYRYLNVRCAQHGQTCVHANKSHSCVCDPNQMNALALTNQCTENVRLLFMPTTDIHASPPLTHKIARLVSLPRASTFPENLL